MLISLRLCARQVSANRGLSIYVYNTTEVVKITNYILFNALTKI
jgi:hypothetical protein